MTNEPYKPQGAGISETYRVESRRGLDEKMFFLIFTPWPSTKILADPGLEPALVEPISFTFPALTTMPFLLGSPF